MTQVICNHQGYKRTTCNCKKTKGAHTVCSNCGGHPGEQVLVTVRSFFG